MHIYGIMLVLEVYILSCVIKFIQYVLLGLSGIYVKM